MGDRAGQQFGNYRLVRLLGQGGYAEVYLGEHLRLNQQAAIKILHAHLSESEAEHFQQEAQTISTLVHPSIIRVFDYDVQDGIPFLVMDYAPNGSLRQRYPKGSLVPLPQIASCVKQVADALQYAHEQRFIHRDVKPENMLLGRREEVLLSDFGIATIAHSSGSLSTHEATGTLTYMAPEQIEGHPRPASDQYSLGCAVYEWLCGSRPFEGSPTEVMVQQLSMPPQPLRERIPTIPSEVEQVVLKALAKDPKARFASVHDFATVLEDVSQPASVAPSPFIAVAVPADGPAQTVETPDEGAMPEETSQTPPDRIVPAMSLAAITPVPIAPPLEPTLPVRVRQKGIARRTAVLLIGLAVLIVAGGVVGSLALLAHFGLPGVRKGTPPISPVRGGTWTVACVCNIDSLIPNGSYLIQAAGIDQALYLPLFYGDAQGMIHAGAASVVPTVQNGGISADARTWTFHLRPGLVWSDGQPYDARDVDYSWKLWLNPAFGPAFPTGLTYVPLSVLQLISSAEVSLDHLSITFHLKQPYVPFLQFWIDGIAAPLPAHHFSNMTPGQIAKSPDNLKPQVVSGAFLMAESVSGNHFTLVRNPHYYLASQGLPYLDKVVLRDVSSSDILKDLQANTFDSTAEALLYAAYLQDYKRLRNYTLVTPPTSASFEALWFNFHNTVLASHLEVRQAIADAIDYQALIQALPLDASKQCTNHSSFFHPGYDPADPCPIYDPTSANQLLDSNGWVRGSDGVRTRAGQHLEFEYTLPIIPGDPTRFAIEAIVQRDLQAIGIKLDIQNIPEEAFFNGAIQVTEASPPTGALPGRNDILEIAYNPSYDPDDSSMFACDQFPPSGGNLFYCNHALDALYQQELTTLDPGARQNIFAQIHLIYLKDFPMVVLFGTKEIYLVHTGTHNFQPSPVGAYAADNIWEWWCDGGKC